MDEKPKRGKGRPKNQPAAEVVLNNNPPKIDNSWRQANNYMLRVYNLDYANSEFIPNKSLLGFVEGFGDWDFGLKYPFFSGSPIKSGNGEMSLLRLYEEEILHAFVALGDDSKPTRLLLFGRQKVGPNNRWVEKSVVFNFKSWDEGFEWMEP